MEFNNQDLLLIVDMQNVYLPGQPWECKKITDAILFIKDLIKKLPKNQIIFTQYVPFQNPTGVWKEYNSINSEINKNPWMNDYVKDLKPYLSNGNLYTKSTYSCCKNTELHDKINCFERVFLTGVVAECCILSTVFDLIDMGKKIVYLKDGIAGKNRKKEEMIQNLLKELSPLHIVFE